MLAEISLTLSGKDRSGSLYDSHYNIEVRNLKSKPKKDIALITNKMIADISTQSGLSVENIVDYKVVYRSEV